MKKGAHVDKTYFTVYLCVLLALKKIAFDLEKSKFEDTIMFQLAFSQENNPIF
jgi:hypothetical protein